MTQSFVIRIAVDTPVSLQALLHLDGLLGWVLIARGQPLDDMPLERTAHVWHGSAAMLETGIFGASTSTVARVKHIVPASAGTVLDHLPARQRTIGPMSPMRPKLTHYPLLEGIRAVWFTGPGDLATIMDVIDDVRSIGKMNRVGYGRVTGIEAMDTDDDPNSGIVVGNTLPARTVPLATWQKHFGAPPRDALIGERRYQPPYWTGEAVTCISPMQNDLMGTRTELATLTRSH